MPQPESIQAYADRALTAQQSAGGHLPLPADGYTAWDSFPYEARPARMPQLRGTFNLLWDDILPPLPDQVRADNAAAVVARVGSAYGGVAHA